MRPPTSSNFSSERWDPARQEIAGLRFAKVLLEDPIPHLVVDVAVLTQGERGWAQEGEVKSESSKRKVPLPPTFVEAFRWWWREGWAQTYGRQAPEAGDVLFPGRLRDLARPRVAKHLRDDLRRAGQPTAFGPHPFTFHHLRHSCATWLDQAGVDEPTIGALLGHEGKTVTRRHYTAATLVRLAGAAMKIPLRWRGPLGLGAGGADGTNGPPLNRAETLRSRVFAVVMGGASRETAPSQGTSAAFVNRRSGVQFPKVAPGFLRPTA